MTVVHRWLAEPLPRAVAQALERLAAAPGARHVAVMPDVHLADHVCVGTVLGTEDRIYPQAVGADIGCGMAALRLHGDAALLADADAAERTFAALRKHVAIVRRQQPQEVTLTLSDETLSRAVQRDARIELGTLGRGNHFLELQADVEERLWLMVHSGSRAVGQAIHHHHLGRGDKVGSGLVALAAEGAAGQAYLHDVAQALQYAAANRRAIADGAAAALGEALAVAVEWDSWFDCHHNFVASEQHDGSRLWVHRKGAISARASEPGIIPGSMGSRSFHVEGRGHSASLCSSSHGAGRRLARGEAARTISVRDLERDLRGVWFDQERAARLRDEAPAAYKDIGAVMRAQRELTRVVRELRPVLSFKGC